MYSRNVSSNLSSSRNFFVTGNKIDISQVLLIKFSPIFSSSTSAILPNLIVIVSLQIYLVIYQLLVIWCRISSSVSFWILGSSGISNTDLSGNLHLSHLEILYSPKKKWNYRLYLLVLLLLLARWSRIS